MSAFINYIYFSTHALNFCLPIDMQPRKKENVTQEYAKLNSQNTFKVCSNFSFRLTFIYNDCLYVGKIRTTACKASVVACTHAELGTFGILKFFNKKIIVCIFYQVNLIGSGLFK